MSQNMKTPGTVHAYWLQLGRDRWNKGDHEGYHGRAQSRNSVFNLIIEVCTYMYVSVCYCIVI